MKIKFNKNAFLELIFINSMIINIRSINDNEFKNNELFTCPKEVNNYEEMDHHARCMRIKELYALLEDFHSLKEKKREDLDNYSEIKKRLEVNLSFSVLKKDRFLKWIEKYGDKKTKEFFMLSDKGTKSEETK